MTPTLSEFSADAVQAFRAESAGDVVMPRLGDDRLPVVERRSWA